MEFPLSVVKRTDLPGLEPPRNAMEVERMVADSPGHCTFLTSGRRLVSLTLNTWWPGSYKMKDGRKDMRTKESKETNARVWKHDEVR